MSNTELKSDIPKGVFITFLGNGAWLYHKGEYEKAIDNYTMALALKPNDKHCFVGRSKCYLRMGQLKNALTDAKASIYQDKSFYEGWYQLAEVYYCMEEFEFAVMSYHRGYKLRPQMDEFRLGIQKAEEAIKTAIGNATDIPDREDLSEDSE